MCDERYVNGFGFIFDNTLPAGAYCEQVIKAKYLGSDGYNRFYAM